jgi:uncharacterized membrane protein
METGLMVMLIVLLPLLIYETVLIIIRKNKPMLTMKQRNWWLIIHILFAIVWLGGALGTLLLVFTTTATTNRELIYAAHLFVDIFDKHLNIPGALGCLITGIVISLRTHWGITKYYWIITKLVANIGIIYVGGSLINDWAHNTVELSANDMNFLHNPIYLQDRQMLVIGLIFSVAVLIFVVAISRFKPWGKRKSAVPNSY